MNVIYFIKPPAILDYAQHLTVEKFTVSERFKGLAIKLLYKDKEITIPITNIEAIEEI